MWVSDSNHLTISKQQAQQILQRKTSLPESPMQEAMASITTSTQPSYLLEIPDEEAQRGRKRRRSSGTHTTSVGSTTLRGRGRRRSISTNILVPAEERHRSRSLGRKSPGKKYAKKYLNLSRLEKKKRSQSLSRSRSTGQQDETKSSPTPRRRQRTRSRSRVHGDKKVEEGTNESMSTGLDSSEVAVED
jgi:hypothetical protein